MGAILDPERSDAERKSKGRRGTGNWTWGWTWGQTWGQTQGQDILGAGRPLVDQRLTKLRQSNQRGNQSRSKTERELPGTAVFRVFLGQNQQFRGGDRGGQPLLPPEQVVHRQDRRACSALAAPLSLRGPTATPSATLC